MQLIPTLRQNIKHAWQVYSGVHGDQEITIIESYIGPANAAAAVERLITEFTPDVILHAGCAGASNPDLMPGDVVIGKTCKILCSRHIFEVRKSLLLAAKPIRYKHRGEAVHKDQLDADKDLLALALEAAKDIAFEDWLAGGWPADMPRRPARIVAGVIGSRDGWTKDPDELKFVRTEFGADCEDMESAYIAQIAEKHEIPFLAARAISNNEHVQTLKKGEIFPAVAAAGYRAVRVIYAVAERLGAKVSS